MASDVERRSFKFDPIERVFRAWGAILETMRKKKTASVTPEFLIQRHVGISGVNHPEAALNADEIKTYFALCTTNDLHELEVIFLRADEIELAALTRREINRREAV